MPVSVETGRWIGKRVEPEFTFITPEGLRVPRVVVVGMGAITPLGLNADASFRNLVAGRLGASSVDLEYTTIKVAGTVKNFRPQEALSRIMSERDFEKNSRASLFANAATGEALTQAGLLTEDWTLRKDLIDPKRIGVEFGSGVGGLFNIGEVMAGLRAGNRRAAVPSQLLASLLERVASTVSIEYGLKGPLRCPSGACATGNLAITGALEQIWLGNADAMVAGGVDAAIQFAVIELFKNAKALSATTDPETASRPFDQGKTGFIFGEGAGALVLMRLDLAMKLNRPIYAEVRGYGNTADAHHDTYPSGEGSQRAIQRAWEFIPESMRDRKLMVNAHGTSTDGDKVEALSIKRSFDERRWGDIIVVAPKGGLTHTIGGAGAAEAVMGIKAMNEGVIFPNVNLKKPIPEVEGLDLPTEARTEQVDVMMNNSFGFGGINSVSSITVFEP